MRLSTLVFVMVTAWYNLVRGDNPSRPHIVLIVADDLGWNDVGFHGSEIKTPNIDKLAYDGMILNNYYVSPICTPTRGSLMTGRHPIHLGLQHYVIAASQPWGLPLQHTTMGQHFQRLGYATHIVGKWHLGFSRDEYLPINRGFKSHFGYWAGKEDYYNHLDKDWHLGYFKSEYVPTERGFDSHYGYWNGKEDYYNHIEKDAYGYIGLDFRNNMEIVNKTAYSTELYTAKAVDIISMHNKSQPLFLYMAHQAVHAGNGNDPLQAPTRYVDRFPYIENKRRRTFAGMVAALDDSVGDIVRTLSKHNMMDNTIIVFTTDNGGPANNYDGNAACNYPLRGTKNTMWEGGVHGVGFVHSRLLKHKHVKTSNMIHVSDWLPTLYSAAGGSVSDLGQLDGLDLWNMIKTNGDNVRNELLHNIDPKEKFSAIRVGDFKLVKGHIPKRDDKWYPCNPPQLLESNITDSYKMNRSNTKPFKLETLRFTKHRSYSKINTPYVIECGNPPANYSINCQPHLSPCLFNIAKDPCEYRNIADDNPSIVKRLLERIEAYAETAVKPVNKPSDPDANPALHGGVWVPWEDT